VLLRIAISVSALYILFNTSVFVLTYLLCLLVAKTNVIDARQGAIIDEKKSRLYKVLPQLIASFDLILIIFPQVNKPRQLAIPRKNNNINLIDKQNKGMHGYCIPVLVSHI